MQKSITFKASRAAMIAALLFSFITTGCNEREAKNTKPANTTVSSMLSLSEETEHYLFSIDISGSSLNINSDNAVTTMEFLDKHLHLSDETNVWKGYQVSFSTLGGSGIPPIVSVEIESDNKITGNKKRRLELWRSKKEELKQLVDSFFSIERTDPVSYLHRGQSYQFNYLSRSTADNKRYYRISDGLESSTDSEFSKHLNDIDKFRSSFDEISEELDRKCKVNDLEGIQIYLLGSPDYVSTEAIAAANEFWMYYLGKHNATVQITANLESIN